VAARDFLFTSESVTEGHPDKIADQVSDSVLDAVLRDDPDGRVACETLITTGLVLVAGEITTETYVDIPRVVRDRIADIGYTHSEWGFDANTCSVVVAIDEQSPDIAQGVNVAYEVQHDPGDVDPLDRVGAGDQGMMFGYASSETPELMPLPIMLAHKISRRLAGVRKSEQLRYLRPDGKAQVTVRYEVDAHGRETPVEIVRVLVSTQHAEGVDAETIKEDVIEHVLHPILDPRLYDERRLYDDRDFVYVNPTGKFVLGGPMGDTGVTGRKIIVDTYGGAARHGGGAFSGKDPTKVDRSAAYAARYVAKNLVAAGLADRAEVNVAYAIGVAHPVSIAVRTFDTEHVPVARIEELVHHYFDLRPAAILRDLDLRRPIYAKTAAYGHFGRDDHDFSWERIDKAADLRRDAGLDGEPPFPVSEAEPVGVAEREA
jgi:S-adenosylmethionine synthetase